MVEPETGFLELLGAVLLCESHYREERRCHTYTYTPLLETYLLKLNSFWRFGTPFTKLLH